MSGYDIYTAVAMQTEIKCVETRDDIRRNLNRCLELIDVAPQCQLTAKDHYGNWAPIKLICFPEFSFTGHEGEWTFEHYLKSVLIEIPGEETRLLADKAKEYGVYIAAVALERDAAWIDDGYFFNTHFIISPNGEIIHKYRKYNPAAHMELSVSPHDVYDKYVAMYGDSLSTFFPVTTTEIGKLGTLTCMDGNTPEAARALGMQGCEVMLHPCLMDPLLSPPMEVWQAQNRMAAWTNVCYVIAPDWGALFGRRPKYIQPGKSMILNYSGVVLAYADHHGESIISATINLEELRRRRLDPSRNFPALMRNEVYRKIYEPVVYPANQFAQASPKARKARDPRLTIEEFVAKGIYVAPEKMPEEMKPKVGSHASVAAGARK